MNRGTIAVLVAAALCATGVASAHAGPCTTAIAQFEQAVRQSAGNPTAGPYAPQSLGAQLMHEPTPASIKRAQARAWRAFRAQLSRAKRLDRRGDQAGCTAALARAKGMYNLH
jgi:hypothetical protein